MDIGNGLKLRAVSNSPNIYTITSSRTGLIGWRAVYLGYNKPTDLTRFHMGRYRRLIPDNHIKNRPAKRLAQFGFSHELKISSGLFSEPSTFWGNQGKQLLIELNTFLSSPQEGKSLPHRRSIIFPWKPSKGVIQVWINGVYQISLVDSQENEEFIQQLQGYDEYPPATIVQALRSFQLPQAQ
jgi:hypothetical protein